MVRKLVDELGLSNARVSLTVGALIALMAVVVWGANEITATRNLHARVSDLDGWKRSVEKDIWKASDLAQDIGGLKSEMQKLRDEMGSLRVEIAKSTARQGGVVSYRIPESSRAAND